MTIDVVFRNEKGDELTWEEMDANLANLKVAIETKKDNFSILPIAQGGTGVATINEAKQVLEVPEFANQIEYMPAGTGAVQTDVQTVLRESVSVTRFGAVGDGVTNDSVAVQAALAYASANGKAIQLVAGHTYNCAGSTIDVSCDIYGNDASIKGYIRVTGNDVTLKDFHIVGTNANIALYLFGSTSIPTRYYRQKIQNVRITFDTGVATADSFGLYASNIDYLEVTGCNIQYGIQLIGCTNYRIDGNVLDGNNYANNNELIHASLKSTGIISNNTFIDSLDNYIDLYSSGEKTIIQNNRFLGCKTRTGACLEIKVTLTDTSNTSSDANGWSEQIIIDGNYFGNTQAYAAQLTQVIAVFYLDSRAAPSFSWADTPRNIIISNNIFDGFDATNHGSSYFMGIYLNTVNAAIVDGNVFRNMALASSSDISSCVWIEKCQDVTVTNNRISMKDGTGVSLHDSCESITVSHNHMLDDLNKSHVLKYGVRVTKEGSRPAPIVTNSNFIGNIVKASLSCFRHLYSSGGYINDCIITGNVFSQECSFQYVNRCTIANNKFEVTSTRNYGVEIGNLSAVSAHNIVFGNTVKTPSGTPKPGMSIYRLRGGQVSNNIIHTATYGILFVGTSVAGELDYLNVKDNFSISQTQANFPHYSSMNAGDTASLQASNNQKIT